MASGTWCPWAIRLDGPLQKTNAGVNQSRFLVAHSMEGALGNALARLRSLNPDAQVSWTFSNPLDGHLYQHYPLETQTWHARAAGNVGGWGVEHENQYFNGSPMDWWLTESQVDTFVRLAQWLAEVRPGTLVLPWERLRNMYEHREVPGNATACPDARIPWDNIMPQLSPPPPPPVLLDGIGVRLDDGTDLGNILPPLPPGRTVAFVGAHLTDGSTPLLWPQPQP